MEISDRCRVAQFCHDMVERDVVSAMDMVRENDNKPAALGTSLGATKLSVKLMDGAKNRAMAKPVSNWLIQITSNVTSWGKFACQYKIAAYMATPEA